MSLAEADEPRSGSALLAQARSRRALLTGAAGASGAAILAGCGATPLRQKIRGAAKVPAEDVPILNGLLDAEQYAVVAYAAAIPLLGYPSDRAARQFLSQEMAHVVELTDLIKLGHGTPRKPQASYNLGHPRDSEEARLLLARAEDLQLRRYLKMTPSLTSGHIKAVVATIFANDAQHLAMLRSLSGQPPIPTAFVTG